MFEALRKRFGTASFVFSQVQFTFFFDSELLVELMARSIFEVQEKREEAPPRQMVLLREVTGG